MSGLSTQAGRAATDKTCKPGGQRERFYRILHAMVPSILCAARNGAPAANHSCNRCRKTGSRYRVPLASWNSPSRPAF
jgi:hypothetical protein